MSTAGENAYFAEVEHALSPHEAVVVSSVIGLPGERWGETVHAVIVTVLGATVNHGDLTDHVLARLAEYKVLRSIELVDQLPLSGTGKVLKRELRKQSQEKCG